MARTRAERRHNDWAKARRKRNIVREVYHWAWLEEVHDLYDNLHQYSKNKIHCSCPMCSNKSNGRGRWGSRYNWPVSVKRRIEEMDYEAKELDEV